MHYDRENDDKNEILQYVKNNGTNGIIYIEYSYKQIGLTDKWLHDMYNHIGNPIVVKREILLMRIQGSTQSPWSQEDLEYLKTVERKVIEEIYLQEHFRLDVYKPLNKRIPYIVGIDCSTGTNGDNNAITIIDPYTEEPSAEFLCPYIGESSFERLIIELIRDIIPRGIVVIERNSVGDGVVDHLLESPIAHRLYYDKGRDLVESNMVDNTTVVSILKRKAELKSYYGVYTGEENRRDMIAILMRRMAEYKDHFVTHNITDDIMHLVQNASGKVAAAVGQHDDSIMSYLIAMYVFYHGNNLPLFGYIRGSTNKEEKEISNEIDYDRISRNNLLPSTDVLILKSREEYKKENNYEEMLRNAIAQSQKESMQLSRKGLVTNRTFSNTPKELIDDYFEDDNSDINLSIFNELNGF